MGEGIAQNFAQGGLSVRVFDQNTDILTRCFNQVGANLRLFAEFGLLPKEPSLILSRMEFHLARELEKKIKDCAFVVESIPEVLPQKRELFARLDSCHQDVILSSNTSSFTMSAIAEGMRTPGRVIGLHYFMPAHIVPLVEIHRGKNTADEVVEVTRQLMVKVGKKPVLVGKEVPGLIVNRIQTAMMREANYLVEQGVVTPEDFDMAARASYGFRLASLGPFAQLDINGLDTVMRGNEQIYKVLSNTTEPSPAIVEKVKRGELGLKSGQGYYDYRGKSKEQIIEERDRNLLKQLILFNQL
ncbi:MAG: hypothetical protein A2144_02520 [Chloroflexi bacterium RBG_16_50_9]|nr:MAG: hypothetical protein A2144_02520 [Chloroflexi bacterium RBG_16_50_9]